MSVYFHLRLVGLLLVLLGLSHAFFNRYFGWSRELESVSLLTRRVFFVHMFFIAFGIGILGALTFAYARDLQHPSSLNRGLLASASAFWFCRLLAQFVGYDPAIWRGNRFRTFMHVAFTLLWTYITAIYVLALLHARAG